MPALVGQTGVMSVRAAAAVTGAGAVLAGALWWRRNPSACPYGQRFWLAPPRPVITRERLRDVLAPQPGERVLEVGPGTGHYAIPMAGWLLPGGRLDVFDIQQKMLDHTLARAQEFEYGHVVPQLGDAQQLPYDDGTFDAAYLVTVLGEIPDPALGVRELARVLRPGGRLVVGELFPDPHFVRRSQLDRDARAAGLRPGRSEGGRFGYFARYER